MREGEVASTSVLADGRGKLEMIAAEGCRIVDKPLIDTNFPRGAMIVLWLGSRAYAKGDVIRSGWSLYLQLQVRLAGGMLLQAFDGARLMVMGA